MAAPIGAPAALSVRGLTTHHAGRLVLEDVSFSAPAGAVTAVLGEAGAGKTILLASIAGLVKISRGAVLVAGTDVSSKRPAARQIGFLAPGTSLPNATLQAALERVAGRANRNAVAAVMPALGLADLASMRLADASHGQALAALNAARLLPQGAVLLIDEAAAGLSWSMRENMLDRLRAEAAAGRTVLIATRNRTVALAADHLILLQQGRVVQAGAPASVFTEPRDEAAALLTGPANILRGTLRQKIPGGFVWVAHGMRFTQQEVAGLPPPVLGGDVTLCLRPDDLHLGATRFNTLDATVVRLVCEGSDAAVHCDSALGRLRARCPAGHALRNGMAVTLEWDISAAIVLAQAA